ncbi:MAG: hypothetical protein COX81_00820 [Candidatus Magasanikbacteria bacterium CG_4_10_14_0_2_um_filter_37_12]|uniref:Uncharacterized protein n=1 Tax=Candidatus Magasanikbacteria bacterium CG_4_10_14_0_2_um_filter_37_12 TaxID=1974637 RepID=A0A2M7V9F8_9BACT|nr:MAG: hypothetical protein COX81_00820 [Candidatus Magasanikbacteria bacterium CG_4_10_14_0_2_um_filter_37_12]
MTIEKNNQNKKSFWLLFAIAVGITIIMPLPRYACFDGCQWAVASILTKEGLIFIFTGIFLVIPFLLSSGIYILLFTGLLSFVDKIVIFNKTKIRWMVGIVLVTLTGTLIINIAGYLLVPHVKTDIQNQTSYIKIKQSISIGMTKTDVRALYPDAVPDSFKGIVPEDPEIEADPFIGANGLGGDCLRIDIMNVCFKDDKVFGLYSFEKKYLKIHDDYKKTLATFDFSNPDTCESLDSAPYYMGYPSKKICYKNIALTTNNSEYCYRVEKNGDQDCLSDLTQKTGDESLCEDIDYKKNRQAYSRCIVTAATNKNDISLCDQLQEKNMTSEYKFCKENVMN